MLLQGTIGKKDAAHEAPAALTFSTEYLTEHSSPEGASILYYSLSLEEGEQVHKFHTTYSWSEAVRGSSSIQMQICLTVHSTLSTIGHTVFFAKHDQPVLCFLSSILLLLQAASAWAFI